MILGLNTFQRITLNLTLLLVGVAQKIATSSLLPVTDQRLWLVDFVGLSFIWIAITLLENVFVASMTSIRDQRKKKLDLEKLDVSENEPSDSEGGVLPKVSISSNPSSSSCLEDSWFYSFSLKKFDTIYFFLSFSSYIVFLIIMMTSTNVWENGVGNTFLWSNSTITD